jgi:glycosyltransferase involved in cell wall biosynthesis
MPERPAATKPVALVTGVVSDHRVEPFRALAEREQIEILAWDDPGPEDSGLPVRHVSQREAAAAVAGGGYRAVICGLGGRMALPATYAAARRRRIPFVLWASLWEHPRTPAHFLSWIPMRTIYRRADAVVTYGPHVTRYVERFRHSGNIFEAPQAVDPAVFGRAVSDEERAAARARAGASDEAFLALFAGRLVPEKGIATLLEAWEQAALPEDAVLALAGGTVPERSEGAVPLVRRLGHVPRSDLPPLYAAADTLVLPSLATATFREPWGLVVNEAMHQGTPVIASDAVGAAAGGLVADGRTGFVVPAGDAAALAARLTALATSPGLRERLGTAGRSAVAAYTPEAWADGMAKGLRAVGAGA